MPAPALIPSMVVSSLPQPPAVDLRPSLYQPAAASSRLVHNEVRPVPQSIQRQANVSGALAPGVAPTDRHDSVDMATLPSALSDGTDNTQSPATFQLDLLNKDGRIGIYLPDARRARIARFHAKRQMRIWRKRIKYDCRKKLADSRPRIKGRFVKRSDMDDDN
jgi:CCT motif